MKLPLITNLRTKLTVWYVVVLAALLLIYATLVFAFQYIILTHQIVHDEVQDVITVEGLLYFDTNGVLQLRQDYYSRPQSHLLVDRLMEVHDLSGHVLYRSPTLHGMALGEALLPGEGDTSFNERIVRLSDGSHVFVVSHVHSMDGKTLIIRLGYNLSPLRSRMWQFLILLAIAIPIALAIAALAGHAISRRALRPLEQMTTRAEGITASNLHSRLHIENPDDELGQMARVFNHLLDRLEQAFRQLHRFTADAAHELRTPLSALRTIGEVALAKEESADEYREALQNILEETARLDTTIESLLLLARAEASQPGEQQTLFAVSDLVDEILNLLQIVIEEKRVSILKENETSTHPLVRADRSLLRVAILNVLHNALKFSPDGSILRITYTHPANDPTRLSIAFHDQGPGIAPGEHLKIFDRFFTGTAQSTASKSGTGLGLSITRLIIDRSGGSIEFDQHTAQGAKCIMTLPIAWPDPPAHA